MSSTTPTPARDDDAAGSHLTIEDAGSTTDAGTLASSGSANGAAPRNDTLFHNDTNSAADDSLGDDGAGSSTTAHAVRAEEVPTEPSKQVDPATAGTYEHRDDRDDASDGVGGAASGSTGSTARSGGLAALIGDDSIAHVFDQTNGVIDGLDGDSDGTADSDVHAAADRADENPAFDAFADTESAASPETDDPRRTGN